MISTATPLVSRIKSGVGAIYSLPTTYQLPAAVAYSALRQLASLLPTPVQTTMASSFLQARQYSGALYKLTQGKSRPSQLAACIASSGQVKEERERPSMNQVQPAPILDALRTFPTLNVLKSAAFRNSRVKELAQSDRIRWKNFKRHLHLVRSEIGAHALQFSPLLSDLRRAMGPDYSLTGSSTMPTQYRVSGLASRENLLAKVSVAEYQLAFAIMQLAHFILEDAHSPTPFGLDKERQCLQLLHSLLKADKYFLMELDRILDYNPLNNISKKTDLMDYHTGDATAPLQEGNTRIEECIVTIARAQKKVEERLVELDLHGPYRFS